MRHILVVLLLVLAACQTSTHGAPQGHTLSSAAPLLTPLPMPSSDWWRGGQLGCPKGTVIMEASESPGVPAQARTTSCVDTYDRVSHGPVAAWRADGTLKMVGWMQRGLQHGRYLYFDASGQLRVVGFYRDGRIEGTWKRYRADGSLRLEESYELGLLEGRRVLIESDESRRVDTYARGELHGLVSAHHPNGRIALRGAYRRGVPDGTWRQFAVDGRELGKFSIRAGAGPYRVWHPNGTLAVSGAYENGQREGVWAYFAADGQQIGSFRVKGGDGPVREYYATGRPKLRGAFRAGKRDGVWTWLRADGRVSREVAYDQGAVIVTSINKPIGGH